MEIVRGETEEGYGCRVTEENEQQSISSFAQLYDQQFKLL